MVCIGEQWNLILSASGPFGTLGPAGYRRIGKGQFVAGLRRQQGLSKLHALVHLREGATENRDEARLPSRTRQRKPHSDSQNSYASKSKNWKLGLWGSSDASNLRGQLWYVSSPPFHPLIHSGRMTWMISFTFLVQATSISSSPRLSRPCLIGWRVMANPPCCEDRSRTHDACNASRST